MASSEATRDSIVDAAITLAERSSWEAVQMHEVAAELGVPLDEVRRLFREKEDLVEVWFDRADSAMLKEAEAPEFGALAPRQRLQRLLMAWLEALAPHRRVTRQMVCSRLEPGRLRAQLAGAARVGRTIRWLREAARRKATFPRRAVEESALTAIYLLTFFWWLNDNSQDSAHTRRFVDGSLARAERLSRCLDAFAVGRVERSATRARPPHPPPVAPEEPTI